MIKLDRYGNKALSDYFKNAVLWLIILGVLILIFSNISDRNKPTAMKYSDFVAAVNSGQIKQVTIDGLNINGEKKLTDHSLKLFVRKLKTLSLCQA